MDGAGITTGNARGIGNTAKDATYLACEPNAAALGRNAAMRWEKNDTARAKPIVADGRKTCQGNPRDIRLSRPCPQSQDWECGGLRHDRIISVRQQRMNGKGHRLLCHLWVLATSCRRLAMLPPAMSPCQAQRHPQYRAAFRSRWQGWCPIIVKVHVYRDSTNSRAY